MKLDSFRSRLFQSQTNKAKPIVAGYVVVVGLAMLVVAAFVAASLTSDPGTSQAAAEAPTTQTAVRATSDGLVNFAPGQASESVVSATSGNWSDPKTWNGGKVPSAWAHVRIKAKHTVSLDSSAKVFGLDVKGVLEYSTEQSTEKQIVLRSNRNVVVTGTLKMGYADDQQHQLRFVDVDQSAFVGGGLDVLDSDVGLWVMEDGQLLAEGSERRGWSTATHAIAKGDRKITVEDATGWRVGDSIAIAPTMSFGDDELASSYDGFHQSRIRSINGNTITLRRRVVDDHPKVNNTWTAEVMNLTRSVIIGGINRSNKAHIFIRSSKPSRLRFVEIVNSGPGRIRDGGWRVTGQVDGRYGLHIHHSGNGSNGMLVEGVTMRDFGFRGFVPHMSHGITFRDTVAFGGGSTAYWWDQQERSNDILFDRTIGAKIKSEDGVYFLATGDNVEVRDSVAVGSIVVANSGAYEWENGDTGSWEFSGNIAHNLRGNGIRIWQNTQENHVLSDFAIYNIDEIAIRLGAYTNNYHLKDFSVFGYGESGLELLAVSRQPHQASSKPAGLVVENGVIDGADTSTGPNIAIREGAVPGTWPILVRNVELRGRGAQEEAAVWLHENANDKKLDFVDVDIAAGPTPDYFLENNTAFDDTAGDGESWIRIQKNGAAKRLRPGDQNRDRGADFIRAWNAWSVDIDLFAPTSWGNGTGLLGEYYNNLRLTQKRYESIDPYIEFFETEAPIYHTINPNESSARWTGFIQAQETGRHTLVPQGEKVRLWIDGKLVVNSWNSTPTDSGPLNFVAGQRYAIRFEVGNRLATDQLQFFADLMWVRPSQSVPEYIPQSQMYPPDGVADRPFVRNDPPIDAGS